MQWQSQYFQKSLFHAPDQASQIKFQGTLSNSDEGLFEGF